MKWNNVTEKLPKKDGFYNVWVETDEGELLHSLWFEDGEWKYDNYMSSSEPLYSPSWYAAVLFWQPLPKPPK